MSFLSAELIAEEATDELCFSRTSDVPMTLNQNYIKVYFIIYLKLYLTV